MRPRPWRLTRRQRVEMEAALARIRRGLSFSAVYDGARLLGVHDPSGGVLAGPRARILPARVAIALRAALRADEDARCEEAYAAAGCPAWGHADLGDVLAYDWGALAALGLLREWPGLARDLDTGRVQLALWEVVR